MSNFTDQLISYPQAYPTASFPRGNANYRGAKFTGSDGQHTVLLAMASHKMHFLKALCPNSTQMLIY